VTVQWCAIEESDLRRNPDSKPGGHNFGMILGYEGKDATIHHNLFAHHSYRTPLCGLEVLDHRNNVIYNVGVGLCWHPPRMNRSRRGEFFRANVIGNCFMAGPTEPKKGDRWIAPMIYGRWAEMYVTGNYFDWAGGYGDPWQLRGTHKGVMQGSPKRVETPFPAPAVATQPAREAARLVLAHAGCLPRDAVSRRTIREVRTGAGSWGRHDPTGGLMAGLRATPPPKDTDGDGMPDDWETAHKLDPADPRDAARIVPKGAGKNDRHAGYTYIEFYINDCADRLIAEATRQAAELPDPE
jgi:hypothetical protein